MTSCNDCFVDFLHTLVHDSIAKNDECNRQFKIGDWPRWYYNADESTLTFSKDGVAKVIAHVLLVGTTKGNRWQWTWANGNAPPEKRSQVDAIRTYGEAQGWAKLTTPFLDSDENLGWEMTAVAVSLLEAKGSYRFPTDEGFAYLVYRDIRWVD